MKFYYQKWMEEQAQHLIDATTAAFKAGKIQNPFSAPPPNMVSFLSISFCMVVIAYRIADVQIVGIS